MLGSSPCQVNGKRLVERLKVRMGGAGVNRSLLRRSREALKDTRTAFNAAGRRATLTELTRLILLRTDQVGWRSLVAYLNGVQGVASSNLAVPTKIVLWPLSPAVLPPAQSDRAGQRSAAPISSGPA